MFIDVAKIRIEAGKGGNGSVSFRREKYVASGGPDGGDGGRGGSILFLADDNLSTLMDFRYKRKYLAENGQDGSAKKCSGKGASDLVVRVPKGTLVRDDKTGLILADISQNDAVMIAKGGRGGWGNSHFATPSRQIPRFAKPGLPGEALDVRLELKLIADVGLIGFPNVGKSTLISVISAARPKIANYHFTTLSPVLGVVRVGDEQSFVAADIPGLIEGAAEGVGLGHAFLRHVERCRLLVHVVDVSGSEERDPVADLAVVNAELASFSPKLALRPQIVLGNKCDVATPKQIKKFQAEMKKQGLPCYIVSGATHKGTDELPQILWNELKLLPPVQQYEPEIVLENLKKEEAVNSFSVEKADDGAFVIKAAWLERILEGSDVDDYESLQYFQRRLDDSGILEKLVEMDVQEGDTVRVGEYEFEYLF